MKCLVAVPGVTTLAELRQAVSEFEITDLSLACDEDALAVARCSLDESGLLLLGEVHGVRENPLIVRSLLRELGLRSLALEWEEDLAGVVEPFLGGEPLADDPELMWFGDGRITAGHLAVLRELRVASPLDLTLFNGTLNAELTPDGELVWDWSQHDREMADRVLAAAVPGQRTLVVAGNAHTPTAPHDLGTPMGAHLRASRTGVRDIRIAYGGGYFYNNGSCRFGPSSPSSPPGARLRLQDGNLILDLPVATEATVPHLPHESIHLG